MLIHKVSNPLFSIRDEDVTIPSEYDVIITSESRSFFDFMDALPNLCSAEAAKILQSGGDEVKVLNVRCCCPHVDGPTFPDTQQTSLRLFSYANHVQLFLCNPSPTACYCEDMSDTATNANPQVVRATNGDAQIVYASPELRRVLREQAERVGRGDVNEAVAAARLLEEHGAVKNCNLNLPPGTMKDGDDACVAWFAGQFLDLVASKSWFAMNWWLNCVDRFCPDEAR